MDKIDLSIVLPTYNEKENISKLIEDILETTKRNEIATEIIVVDDSSPDGTANIVKETFKDNGNVRCIVRTEEKGLATAIRTGAEAAQGEHILLMDTDFNHHPKYVPQLYKFAKDYDVVSGSRYVWGGGMKNHRLRYIGAYFFNMFINLILFMRTQDNTSGFVMFKREILDKIHTKKIFRGYGDFYIRFLYALKHLGVSLIEVPVVYEDRHSGESKTVFSKYIFQYTCTALEARFKGRKYLK